MIVRARRELSVERDILSLYRTTCRALSESGHTSVAMIVTHGMGMIRIAQINGRFTSFSRESFDWPDPDSDVPSGDPCVRCLRSGEYEVCNDLQAAAREAPAGQRNWASSAANAGLKSQLALPIERHGRIFTVLSVFSDERDAFEGSVLEMLSSFSIDLSQAIERMQQEARLRDAAAKAEQLADQIGSLLDAVPISLLMLSVPDGRITYVNDVVCRRASMARQDIIGKTVRELPFGLLEEDRKHALHMLATDGRVTNLELMHRMTNGEIAPVLLHLEYVQYLGQLSVMVCTTDIRELREAQKAEQARLEAEAASRAKSEFLTRFGHEMRNPLNAVIGFTQMLRDDACSRLTSRDQTWLDNILHAGWHLLALTNDILDLTSIEMGRVAVTTAALPLAPELDFAIAISSQLAAGNEVKLYGDYEASQDVAVIADQVRLRQVMLNLLSNAIKYNRQGGEVRVRVNTADEHVMIDVVDNGLGMTREQLKQLFEPYNRLGREEGGVEGLGVGLAVSRELLRLMNGRLDADSRPSQGTRFRVTLPRGKMPGPTLDLSRTSTDKASPAVGGLVLYIEDSPINALLVEQLLGRFKGVRFVYADSGRAGLELIDSLAPDLVLLDMQLPDMSGQDLLKRLNETGRSKRSRIVALSGSAMPDEVEQVLNLGAAEYWTKPLVAERFLASVERMLAGPRAAAAVDIE